MIIDELVFISSAIIRKNNKILLLRRSDKNKKYKGFWQLPEGHIEEAESPLDAVKREIKEEINCVLTKPKIKGTTPAHIKLNGRNYLVIRIVFEGLNKGRIKLDADHSEYKWFDLEEVEKIKNDLVPGVFEILN